MPWRSSCVNRFCPALHVARTISSWNPYYSGRFTLLQRYINYSQVYSGTWEIWSQELLTFWTRVTSVLRLFTPPWIAYFEICAPKTLEHKSDMQRFSQRRRGRCCGTRVFLGTSTPQSLLNAVFYLNGKSFCLRGGKNIGDCAFYSSFMTTTQIVMYIQKPGPRTEKAHSWKCTSRTNWYQSIHHHKQVKDAMFIFGLVSVKTTKRCNRQIYLLPLSFASSAC